MEEAHDIFKRAYKQYLDLFGEKHPSTVNVMVNLALSYRDLSQYEEALELYDKILKLRAEIDGKTTMNYAMTLSMASGALRELKRFDEAYEYVKEAYTTMATINRGENNLGCAIILTSMGMLFKRWDKYDRALDSYERALKIREELLGPSHPDTIASRHNIAELYISMSNPERAEEYLKENVKQMKKD